MRRYPSALQLRILGSLQGRIGEWTGARELAMSLGKWPTELGSPLRGLERRYCVSVTASPRCPVRHRSRPLYRVTAAGLRALAAHQNTDGTRPSTGGGARSQTGCPAPGIPSEERR